MIYVMSLPSPLKILHPTHFHDGRLTSSRSISRQRRDIVAHLPLFPVSLMPLLEAHLEMATKAANRAEAILGTAAAEISDA